MHYSALYLVPAIAISPLAPGEFKKQLLTTPSKPRSVGKFFDLLKQTLPEISLPPLSRFSPQAAAPSPLLLCSGFISEFGKTDSDFQRMIWWPADLAADW
jgi:hypothetical protein